MSTRTGSRIALAVFTAFLTLPAVVVQAQIYPPAEGVELPEAYYDMVRQDPAAFQFKRAWKGITERIRINQERISLGLEPPTGERAVAGTKQVPVLAGKFANTTSEPFSPSQLEDQLFNGPNATGTVTQFYTEISGGLITLTGTVYGKQGADSLIQAQFNDTYYEGSCNGLGTGCSQTGDYLKELLDSSDSWVDFGQFDNDGPDGQPNSGDDDGFVDFVAFVHPETGGECGFLSNIWSHRWVYAGWWGAPYTTNDAAFGGGMIRVDDYTIQPLLSCNGSSIIEIGVFAHEFGHAFGLPDLYDTDFSSNGIGRWGLMGYGSWGGDGLHPQTPVHMCAWSKEQLGWVTPTIVESNQINAILQPVATSGQVLKIVPNGLVQSPEYFLIEHRTRTLFDQWLPIDGLAVWHIDNTRGGNTAEVRKLVDLEEADGLDQLDIPASLGDAGDLYPGTSVNLTFDDSSYPNNRDYAGNPTGFGITNISANASQASLDLSVQWHFLDVTSGPLGGPQGAQGVTWVDYDNDGDDDLYVALFSFPNILLRNDGGGVFTDVTSGPIGDAGPAQGTAWGDYDNDGDEDVYIANWNQANKLLRNDGGGAFTDVTSEPLGDTSSGTAVAWVDYDNDGDLDIYLASDNAPNKLFRNDGSGTFTDATSGPLGSNVNDVSQAWADYDNDGDQDLYLGIVVGNNKLLRNDGGGSFVDVTSGPLGDGGNTESVSWGDYDNDGDLDLYLVNGNPQAPNKLLRNDGGGAFSDVTSGPLADTDPGVGGAWFDMENDGDLDLYLCNSNAPNRLYRNDGGGTFTEIGYGEEADAGANRGIALSDYDSDGDLDLYMTSTWTQKLLRNVDASGNHWLHVDLVGTRSNASAIGARVQLFAGGVSQVREISAGAGHWSQDSRTVEFGLGSATMADSIKIFWPGGAVQDSSMIAADQRITITEPTIGPHLADHDVGDVVLTMTDQGTLGFIDGEQSQGSGFIVPSSGENVLYVGSLWVSQCLTYVANRDFTDDPEQEWEYSTSPDGRVIVDQNGTSDQDIRSSYRDTGGSDTRSLFIRQESWAWADDSNDDFVIVRYLITNEADTTQVDFHAGVFLDLDVGADPLANTGGSDLGDQLIYMTDGSGVHAGLRRLGGPQMPEPSANVTFIQNEAYVWPDGYVLDDDKLGFLWGSNAGHSVPGAPVADDYSVLVSVGPFDLAPGETKEVAFALIGGSSLADLKANADQAQIKYLEETGSPADVADLGPIGDAGVRLLPNIPNPFNPQTSVRFQLDQRADIKLLVFDARGRRVRFLAEGSRNAGMHAIVWDGRDDRGHPVSNGTYFLKLSSGRRLDTHRMVLLK